MERALTVEATRGGQAHWRRVESRYRSLLVRVARRLRDGAPTLLHVTHDFVCFVRDEEGGPELAAKPCALFERLFARQAEQARERRAVAERPPSDRAAFLVTRFGSYEGVTTEDAQRELLALGADAVDALTGALSDPLSAERQGGSASLRHSTSI